MKRTLIITLEFPPTIGGIATYIEKLTGQLNVNSVLVLAPEQKEDKNYDDRYPFKVIRKKLFFPKFIWPRWVKLLFIVKKIIKEYDIEAIHVHHILPVGYIAWYCKKYLNIPYIIFSHGTDISAAAKTKRKKKFATKVGINAEQIIVNSESLGIRLKNTFPLLADNVSVVYPCPDDDFKIKPKESEINKLRSKLSLEGKKVLLSVGRLADGKGFPQLIRYMPTILEHFPNLVWIIVGTGPKQKILLDMIKKKNLHNIVRFIGDIPHAEIKKYYYLADLFVLLTHPDEGREEGLGLVFLEAAAAGTPIIAGKSGGVEEAVIDGKTGLVVESYNEANVVKAIKKLLDDTEYAKKLAKSGKQRINTEFNSEEKLKQLQKWL